MFELTEREKLAKADCGGDDPLTYTMGTLVSGTKRAMEESVTGYNPIVINHFMQFLLFFFDPQKAFPLLFFFNSNCCVFVIFVFCLFFCEFA